MSTDRQDDPTAESRKRDHIDLAFKSQTGLQEIDSRFDYEPMMASHPDSDLDISQDILEHTLTTPIWVSSMTGGTAMATTINHNLAKACGEYGMGMGLGSCRTLLDSDDRLADFDVRDLMPNQPLYANLGVAQIEQLIATEKLDSMHRMVDKLRADGLIIHVNPLQEWLQPEGDRFTMTPLAVVEECLEACDYPIIVKEVGQGMGPKSLTALFGLPLQAVDFAAHGGTNFALLELLRSDKSLLNTYGPIANVGHGADEMVDLTNQILQDLGDEVRCYEVIISGGVKTFLDGYYLTEKLDCKAVYGQASGFLRHATKSYDQLSEYVERQIEGLRLANTFLSIKS